MNFIQGISLPDDVLGQNLFPRTYKVEFELEKISNKEIHIKLFRFTSLENPQNYLDQLVKTAFLKKLKEVNVKDFNQFILQLDEKQNSSSQKPSNYATHVNVLIEFNE